VKFREQQKVQGDMSKEMKAHSSGEEGLSSVTQMERTQAPPT
jgi:hypothetical protein